MAKSLHADLTRMMKFPREGIFSTVIIKTLTANCTLMCLARGTDISEHTAGREAAVTVIRGSGIFILDGKTIKMKPGVFIFMPKNAPHSLRARDDLAILLTLFGKETG